MFSGGIERDSGIKWVKNSKSDKIMLNEGGKIVSDERKNFAELSALFFFVANIVSDFKVPNIQEDVPDIRSNHDLVLVAVNTLQNHPSVVNIKHKEFNSTLSFKNTNESLAR